MPTPKKTLPNRSRRLRDPLVGINRRTAGGREIRDLYESRMAAIAGAIEGEPDITLQAAVRRLVELHLLCERLRAKLLIQGKGDASDDSLVRAENMLRRVEEQVAKLVEQAPKPRPFWERLHDDDEEPENGQG
jgi:hypothetical protein